MSHSWKIGDWAELHGTRYLVYEIDKEFVYGIRKSGNANWRFDGNAKRLPDCTGWDWVAPKPIEPPPGYRLVTEGCALDGDMSLQAAGWYFSTCQGDDISELLELGAAKAYARKLEPTYAERQAAWVKEHDVKVGDKVKVLYVPAKDEGGWTYNMSPVKQACERIVGRSFPIEKVDCDSIWLSGFDHILPYFVLEKVVPTCRPFKDAAEFAPYRDKWVKPKSDKTISRGTMRRRIAGYDDSIILTPVAYDYECAFKDLLFEDGTPFGVQVNVGT